MNKNHVTIPLKKDSSQDTNTTFTLSNTTSSINDFWSKHNISTVGDQTLFDYQDPLYSNDDYSYHTSMMNVIYDLDKDELKDQNQNGRVPMTDSDDVGIGLAEMINRDFKK